jgi:hypothetical protein
MNWAGWLALGDPCTISRLLHLAAARSILLNAGCQLVIFLYLLDNETSMVVLASAGVGTAIEFWKVGAGRLRGLGYMGACAKPGSWPHTF